MERGIHTYKEILSQGETWRSTIQSMTVPQKELKDWIRKPWDEVIFTGCGSTYYLSLSAAAIWQSITGIRARAVPASEMWLFPEAVLTAGNKLLIAVSRSGETSETLHAVNKFEALDNKNWLAITCYGERELALCAPFRLLAERAQEQSVAQTRSFSSMFLLSQFASGLAGEDIEYLTNLALIPNAFERLIHKYEPLANELAQNDELQHFVFLGSGVNYGLACEAMLKMKEMSLSVSESFHFLEYRHGPKSMVTPSTLVIGMLNDRARNQEMKVLEEMQDMGAIVLAIDDTVDDIPADYVVEIKSGLNSLERGPLLLPVLQLLAYYRSMEKGLNPDRPKNLDAVVVL
jgi:glucosamine--fructose-6-phosphate aminotransferase (isomerizing)